MKAVWVFNAITLAALAFIMYGLVVKLNELAGIL